MKIITFLVAGLLMGTLFSCASESSAEETPKVQVNLDSILIGTWENISLEVIVNSFNNTDSSFSILVPRGSWEEKLGIKPIKTTYDGNNTYQSEYRNPSDSLIRTTRGIWNIFGDTLMLIEPEATYEYKVRIRESMAEFQSILDWDGDGKFDDSYKGTQIKID
ncbi:MAG: hypothetical protein KDC34_07670 [Saprospiraceae bacterium]|nr:hypothetical protein [Saprospiraceae bacterium]